MKTKLKICDNCFKDRIIWKQHCGRKLCQQCWNKIKPGKTIQKSPTPIAKRSDKRVKQEVVYGILRKQFLKDHPTCMITISGICSGKPSNQVHHRYSGKDRDKYFLDTTTWLSTEQSCHDWVHLHPVQARELGFLK